MGDRQRRLALLFLLKLLLCLLKSVCVTLSLRRWDKSTRQRVSDLLAFRGLCSPAVRVLDRKLRVFKEVARHEVVQLLVAQSLQERIQVVHHCLATSLKNLLNAVIDQFRRALV